MRCRRHCFINSLCSSSLTHRVKSTMDNMKKKKCTMDMVKWSDLPKRLWPVIGKFLHTRLDVTRFRSVCSLWRSSRPPFKRPPRPPRLPLPQNQKGRLFQSTIYRMESLSDSKRTWLMKLEEQPESGKTRLIHPVTNLPLRYTSKEFSLLEFKVVELRKSYVLKLRNNVSVKSVRRLVITPFNDGVFMIYNQGSLGFVRFGDEKLTCVDEQNAHYDDLIVHKDQCYVVDKWGTICWVSPALRVVQFSPPLCGFGERKHLVECCGDLYVVDQYIENGTHHPDNRDESSTPYNELLPWYYRKRRSDAEAIDFKVYKLDQEWGKWVNVKDLGDNMFILGNDGSYSVSTTEFAGVKGNCIFYTDYESLLRTGSSVVCLI